MIAIQKPHMITLFEKPTGTEESMLAVNSILAVASETEIDTLTNGTFINFQERFMIPITSFLCQATSKCDISNDGDTKKALVRVAR